MPWVNRCPAILEAFYPGIRGGAAIARILTGKVNPSGHLPISFPASADQLARPDIAGLGEPDGTPAEVLYDEGAAIGYKWYDVKGYKPLFGFGHGLSYTSFALSDLAARPTARRSRSASRSATPASAPGKGVGQVYVAPADWRTAGWEAPKRLGGFAKAELKPGPGQAHRADGRSAPARDLRGREQQLAHQGRRLSAAARRGGGRADAERDPDPARQPVERGASMKNLRLLLWALVALAVLGAAALVLIPRQLSPERSDAIQFRRRVHFGRRRRQALSSQALEGKPYAIYFGFTRCGDVCPTTLSRLVKLRRKRPTSKL